MPTYRSFRMGGTFAGWSDEDDCNVTAAKLTMPREELLKKERYGSDL